MKKPNVTNIFKTAGATVSRHSPEILTGIGIAGMCTTVILAVKATPKALRLIEDEKNRQNCGLYKEAKDNGYDSCPRVDQLKLLEVVKVAWKPYIPAAVSGIVSISCLIGANSVNARRNAALATAYKLSETAFAEYRDKVVETVGEKKEKVVREKVNEKRITDNPVTKNEIIITEKGNTLFYDVMSSRYFKSDIDTIKRIENKLNKRMLSEMYISLSEFYDEIGIDHTKNSDDLGWNINKDGLIEFDFDSKIADDGTPCIVLDYMVAPRYDFSTLY